MLCACGRLESLYHESGSRVRESRRVYPGGGAIDAAESHQWIAGRGSPRHDHYHVGHAARRYRQPRGAEQHQASTGWIVRIGRCLNNPLARPQLVVTSQYGERILFNFRFNLEATASTGLQVHV